MKSKRYYVIFDGDYEYVKDVVSEDEYDENYTGARCRSFETLEDAENYAFRQNEFAREYYSQ